MNESYLTPNGQPALDLLESAFQRSAAPITGSLDWLDQIRDCNGPTDSPDGRKHDIPNDPNGKAFPWPGASNCKPFTADDVINELSARDLAAFWRALIQRGAGTSDESNYAVALVEHLVFGPMMAKLDKEVELSTQLRHSRGWCLLAPRWKTEFGLRRYEIKLAMLEQMAADAQNALNQLAQNPQAAATADPAALARTQQQAQVVSLILDPTLEAEAMAFLRDWYAKFVATTLPEKFRDRAPKIRDAALRRAVRSLRTEQRATTPLPYVCRNEPEICALEPWREVCLPAELTDAQEVVFQLEFVTPATLRSRILSEGYSESWVTEVSKIKSVFNQAQLPVRSQPLGIAGSMAAASSAAPLPGDGADSGLVRIVHAVYKALDADDIPSAYCTVFHPEYLEEYGKHELVDTIDGKLPYVELVLEWRNRAVTSSRSVSEMVATQQKLIKDTLDQIIDRGSITILPPVNVYESPSGAKYEFGPATQNYVRQGREPQFMQIPSGQGMSDGVAVHALVKKQVDNRFGLMSEDVPPARMQTLQEKAVRRFLIAWTRAFQEVLNLYQQHGEDAEFARVTGAPTGWLEERRATPGILSSIFEFDVRELDADQFIKQVEAMNTVVLPNDVLGVIERGQYATWMARGIVGPRVARSFLRTLPDASAALKEKAELQVLKMASGNPPTMLDKDDPTAATLLEETKKIVTGNPRYLIALTPEALQAVAGDQAVTIQNNMRAAGMQPQPDPLFSMLLMKWVENLTFIGVTQQRNKQIGRQGVDSGKMEG